MSRLPVRRRSMRLKAVVSDIWIACTSAGSSLLRWRGVVRCLMLQARVPAGSTLSGSTGATSSAFAADLLVVSVGGALSDQWWGRCQLDSLAVLATAAKPAVLAARGTAVQGNFAAAA